MLYCIEIDRSGLPEEDMVVHHRFDAEPKREDVLKVIDDLDCGYDDVYCRFNFYKVD